ncbi:helix-turn-helix domain-containing protein [Streptomyces prunicolor]|uniref:helix-turn-helix domain-containing protein n=1 Tax=Streptomyces prunicolor TaxID=67348 RepID=UPI00371EDE25
MTGSTLARRLTNHGIPSRPARATAMVQLAQDMPPAVLSALLGLHLNTVTRWRSRAVTDWTVYLAARAADRSTTVPHTPAPRSGRTAGSSSDKVR